MGSAIAADAVLVLHAAFVVWVLLGGFVVLRRPVWAWAHLPAALWGVWIEWSGGVCPLTPLENRLRIAAGQPGSDAGFIERHLTALIYPEGLTREVQFVLGAIVLLLNAAIYAVVVMRRVKGAQPHEGPH